MQCAAFFGGHDPRARIAAALNKQDRPITQAFDSQGTGKAEGSLNDFAFDRKRCKDSDVHAGCAITSAARKQMRKHFAPTPGLKSRAGFKCARPAAMFVTAQSEA